MNSNRYFKIIINLLIMCMVCPTLCVSANGSINATRDILDVIIDNKPIASDDIYNSQLYDESLREYTINDKPLVKINYIPIWYHAGESIDDLIKTAERTWQETYIVLDKKPFGTFAKSSGENKIICKSNIYDETPMFLTDLINSSVLHSKLSPSNISYTNVLCFDAVKSHQGVVVYYISEENAIVYYYEDYSSNALQFTLGDFQKYGTEYYEYITSYEYNYNKNGEPLYSQGMSFKSYLEEKHPTLNNGSVAQSNVGISSCEFGQTDNSQIQVQDDATLGVKPWVLVVCTVGAFVLGAIAAILIKNKKKQ